QDLCDWNQMITDAFDWTWQSGSTPTLMTGPSADHTGGHYLYIEASSQPHGNTARLISPESSDSGPQCLRFWYHMYGSADTMGLHVYLVQGRWAEAIWRKRNDQGNMWNEARVDFTPSGPFQVTTCVLSDVAIDDVKLHHGPCEGNNFLYIFSSFDCSFDQDLCNWNQMITDAFDWTWQSGSTPTLMTGPSADHTGGGHYLYIEASSQPYGNTARLISPESSDSGPQCLRFWYHMYGSADTMGLHVYLVQGRWLPRVTTQRVKLMFVNVSTTVSSFDCSFDQDLCNWNQMITDSFDWTWQSGSTPTLMTGPSADHTGGGHYLYIEASSQPYGNTARLISPESSDSGPQCLRFWYHMYGSADTMGLHVYLVQGRWADTVWRKRNDQGNMWHEARVDFTPSGPFQVIFEGRRGSNDRSDVAIDDVKLHHGPCAGNIFPIYFTQKVSFNE
uniref:MAM domain-containing protein n=1 Tax=Sphaeramia orbicularis TaxID=375764 RepID=A0A673AX30_9TELE